MPRGLKDAFSDAVTVPAGERLTTASHEFIPVFNEVFGFHDAEVISSELSLDSLRLRLLLNYIVRWDLQDGVCNLTWRKLLVEMEGILWVDFSYSDPEFGFPHQVTRHIEFSNIPQPKKWILPRMTDMFCHKLEGAVLDSINVARFGREDYRFDFVWIQTNTTSEVVYDRIWCRACGLEFTSPPRPERWDP